ncbi:cell surface protein SprA [Salinibacter sp. 10B]|uniref:T9SS outer membrane translocon Sov/SprA n=1 Tax=Salinibacter sp. 10B TaxID=1923971 RepID=UPI000CF3E436|nr:cell surface protein SprA [Salinibacter sp. 10B]PQJ34800.1 cell surface protein SprA [Salinibacter sp. 10B]
MDQVRPGGGARLCPWKGRICVVVALLCGGIVGGEPAVAQERPAPDTTAADTAAAVPPSQPREGPPSRALTSPSLDSLEAGGEPVASPPTGALVADSLTGVESSAVPDTGLVARYLPSSRRPSGALFGAQSPFLGPRIRTVQKRSVSLDSSSLHYTLDDGPYTQGPMRVDAEVYRRESYRANVRDNWTSLVEQRRRQRAERGGVGVRMTVPGGRESAFTTIFGKPQVDLRVNGQADINAGFKYSKNDRQGARTGDATQLDPSFKQDLRLGITGTIGDKMQINVDWDTNNQFDYQNQVKLEYTGYEDEIIQSVEAGNVFLETPSQLISGGQSLFGIKGTFQLGNLSFTTIASQQEGQSNSLSIEGGAETTEFSLQPTDYDEGTHFFLGYYFRNSWNVAHEDPTSIRPPVDQIENIEVWKLQTSSSASEEADVRRVAATVDLGESPRLLQQADEYTERVLPSPEADQYTESDIAALRDGENTSVSNYVESGANLAQPLQTQDWEEGNFKKLEKGRDYRLDDRLGFISLNQRLRPNEALAVAYKYRVNGQVRQIGDFAAEQGGTTGGVKADRLMLKLIRPTNPVAPGPNATDEPSSWFLEMRNVYRLSGRGFTANNFELDVEYKPSGQGATTTLSDISNAPLLQILGLDRVNQSGAPTPDNEFDFTPQVINEGEGLIYFPYLRPFGERILDVAAQEGNRTDGQPYAFENLYLKKKSNAEKEDTEKNVYSMTGSYKGQAQGFYDLKAFTGLVEGSVKVTSGGQALQEGTDYVVDYQSGTVNITNQSYLTDGREINISYEQQSIANLQKKTLLGARADWNLQDRFALGATVMQLSQKSPVDKYRIGQEPINNTIWGVDGSMELEPRWLTQAVDALPLVQTRAESQLSLSGEFAQLRPGHTRTEAFERTVQDVKNSETDSYAPDERSGISYVDDFEGFENTFSLRQQLNSWQISAAPDSLGFGADMSDRARTHWRGSLAWYQLNQQIVEDLEGKVAQRGPAEATELLDVRDVFDRDTRGSANPTLRSLDFYFNPWKRGPYNYTSDLVSFFRNPTRVWGGVTRQLPEGYTDFSVQNVEFVEFIVKPYPQNGQITDGAKLYLNLGTISEDVIPNDRLNSENGLALTFDENDLDELSRIASGSQAGASIDVRNGRTEDLGLDGLVSYTSDPYEPGMLERNFYSDFVAQADSLAAEGGQLGLTSAQLDRLQAEVARIQGDPSADDYHFYGNDRYFDDTEIFPDGATLQQRFAHYYAGQELNSFEAQNQLAEGVSTRRGITGTPDTEDLDGTGGSANITNNYYQYAIPLDSLDQRAQSDEGPTDYVVSKVGRNRDWYKVRIPVSAFTDRVGNIQDFTRIQSIRLWTTGHRAPITMRFASMELVGSQWRKSPPVAQQPVDRGTVMDQGEGELRVASVNNEEDPDYEPPVGAIVSRSRTSTGVQRENREQALLLNVNELEAGRQRGVFKTYQQGLDLLKYSNLRMYTHVHGASNSPQVKERIRKNLRFFVRLGANETGDYYEYEQPLTPNNLPGTEGASGLWQEQNEMNLLLSTLSQLKTARDQSGEQIDTTFTSDRVDLPLDFAPEGTRLKIRGTPSLDGINTVVIGVRHVGDPTSAPPLRNVELWVNELRVSGFDEEGGWATTTTANIGLADLATVQGSFQRQTDGFGSLSSTLDEREQANSTSWNVRTDVNLDVLLPRRQGWSIPVTMQLQSSLTAPQFDPERGDVRISEIQDQFDILPDSTVRREFGDKYPDQSPTEIRETLKDSVRRASQSYNLRRTVTANVSKDGSNSWWVRNTMDATTLNFSYFDRTARSPQRLLNDQWSWSGSFEYQVDFGQPRTIQPLGFLPGMLGDVGFNYVPTSLSFSGSAERELSTTRSRPSGRTDPSQPVRIANPFRETQNFTHNRNFSLQYDPFGFLGLSFDTNTQQTLNDLASRTQRNLIFSEQSVVGRRTLTDVDTSAFFRNPGAFLSDLPDSTGVLRDQLGETIFVENRLLEKSEGEIFRALVLGDVSPRTNNYRQRLSATLRLGILDRKALNWIGVQDVNYQSSFDWQNGAKGSFTGASVRNSVTLRTGVSLHPNRVWERFGFYERLKQAQREAGREESGSAEARSEGSGRSEGPTPGTEEGAVTDSTDGGVQFSDLPLPNPVRILRGAALMVMDIQDLTVNYNGEFSSRSTGVGRPVTNATGVVDVRTHYSLFDAIQGQGPPLGYRLGLRRSIDTTNRVFQDVQVTDNLTNRHRFEARTALSPSSAFNIDLNWNVSWSTQPQIQFQPGGQNGPVPGGGEASSGLQRFRSESGNASASIWAFGSYQSFFERQLNTFRRNVESPETVWEADEVALIRSSVVADFREAYLTGGGRIGGSGFAPFPMPGWTVRYSGLSNWPFIKQVTESVSLNHSYNAEYQTGFNSLATAGDSTTITVVGETFNYIEPEYEPQSIQIQEQYQPIIGIDITWPWELQTSLEWNRRITTALRGKNVVERQTGELSGRLSFSKRGLSLPFFPRIQNRIRFSFTLSRSVSDEREYLVTQALQQARSELDSYDPTRATQGENVDILTKTTRLTMTPKISYSVSNRVTADFQLDFERFDVTQGQQTSYTNVNGTFNVSVSISQN